MRHSDSSELSLLENSLQEGSLSLKGKLYFLRVTPITCFEIIGIGEEEVVV